jgi:K+-sensing histidine kinase KdpD
MKAIRPLRANLVSLIGIVICAWSAALMCFFFQAHNSKYLLPLAFIFVVLVVAMRCGVSAGIIGSVVAAIIFAMFLYQPLGSVMISNPAARGNIGWMLMGGLVLSYLLGTNAGGRQRHG